LSPIVGLNHLFNRGLGRFTKGVNLFFTVRSDITYIAILRNTIVLVTSGYVDGESHSNRIVIVEEACAHRSV
jgi:hypothetical protein